MDSPIKWHGGKHYLASKIIAMMPPHIHYVEPYFGGGSVLLSKNPEGTSEVVNDLNGELWNFWKTLQEPSYFEEFKRRIESTPFSEREWCESCQISLEAGYTKRAVAFFINCRQSLAGRMKDFATLSRTRTRRGMNEQASAWLNAIDGLPQVHARLKRVVILNRDALDVIRQQDGKDTLFYLDPPYLHETRSSKDVYAHEMTAQQHADMLNVLADIEGKLMLSGYMSELYASAAIANGWIRREFDLPNNSAGGGEKRRMTECLWMNFTPEGK